MSQNKQSERIPRHCEPSAEYHRPPDDVTGTIQPADQQGTRGIHAGAEQTGRDISFPFSDFNFKKKSALGIFLRPITTVFMKVSD